MKSVTKNVILDLLPLYLAGDVSDDTRALVEDYLSRDPELERAARVAEAFGEAGAVPAPKRKEAAMKAFTEAKHRLWMRALTLAILITSLFAVALFGALYLFLK